jgi:hypothetical protein
MNTSGRRSAGRRPITPPWARFGVFGNLARYRLEGLAGLDACHRRVGARTPLGDQRVARAFGHADEDLGDVVLRRLAGRGTLLFEHGVDLGVARLDALLDLALAHPFDHQLVADVAAKTCVVDAFGGQPIAQLGQRQLVLDADVGDRTVELGLVDALADFACVGDLHPLVDQRVEHLLAQLGGPAAARHWHAPRSASPAPGAARARRW